MTGIDFANLCYFILSQMLWFKHSISTCGNVIMNVKTLGYVIIMKKLV